MISILTNPHKLIVDDNKLLANTVQKDNVKNYVSNYEFVTEYALNEEQYDQLTKILNGRVIKFAKCKLLEHPHVIPFLLNRIAYDDVCKNYAHIDGVIDIGGSPLRTPKNHHICSLVHDRRTNARYANIALKQEIDDPNNYNYLLHQDVVMQSLTELNNKSFCENLGYYKKAVNTGIKSKSIRGMIDALKPKDKRTYSSKACVNGVLNCKHKSFYAYMINVYDIPLRDFPQIMAQHDIHFLDVYMFLPDALINPAYNLDETFYGTKLINRGNSIRKDYKLQFDLHDDANLYEHDYEEWRNYLTVTVIEGTTISVVSEIIASWGTFKKIRFTKVNSNKGIITRNISMKRYKDYYRVPNLCYWFYNQCKNVFASTFLVPCNFCDTVITHSVSLQDITFTYKNVYSYARSAKTSVRFINEGISNFVYAGVQMPEAEYEHLIMSLYIIAAIRRRDATQTIADVFRHLKEIDGIFTKIKNMFRAFVRNNESIDDQLEKLVTKESFKNILNVTLEPIPDVKTEKVLYSRNESYYVNTIKPLGFIKPNKDAVIDMPKNSVQTVSAQVAPTATPQKKQHDIIPQFSGKVIRADVLGNIYEYNVKPGNACISKIYPNAGAGRCGYYAMKHFCTGSMKLKLNKELQKKYDNSEWYDAIDMMDIAKDNDMNLILHIFNNGGLCDVQEYYCGSEITAKIKWENHHFEAVNCLCPGSGCLIENFNQIEGSLKKAGIDIDSFCYLNETDVNLNDNSGRSQAFANVFKNYSQVYKTNGKKLQQNDIDTILYNSPSAATPVKLIVTIPPTKFDDAYYNNLNRAFLGAGQTVLTPPVGAAGGIPFCCHRRMITDNSVCLNFNNCEIASKYMSAPVCTHGGAIIGINKYVPDQIQGTGDFNNVNKFNDNIKGKMYLKYKELYDHMMTKPEISLKCSFVDLTADVGQFFEAHKKISHKVYNCYSINNDAFETPNKPYSQYVNGDKVVIWDYYMCDDLKELINNATGDNNWLLYKYDPFKPVDQVIQLALCDTIRCDASRRGSGEVYILVQIKKIVEWLKDYSSIKNISVKETHPVKECFDKLDKENAAYQQCDCVINYDYVFGKEKYFNNTITLDVTDDAFKDFIDHNGNFIMADGTKNNTWAEIMDLEDNKRNIYDNVIFKKYDGNAKYQLPCCNGVAGARKTQQILKMGLCKNCTLIVSPFNTHKNAMTFQKACYFLASDAASKVKYVFLDEVFVFDQRYVIFLNNICKGTGKVLLTLGDDKQTGNVDFTGNDTPITADDTGYHILTYRCPKDVVNYCSDYIKSFETTSKVDDSIVIMDSDVEDLPLDYVNYIFLHREDVEVYGKILKDKAKRFYTVKTAQGNTFDRAVLVLPTISLAYNRAYLYTALTRHTTQLVVYGKKDEVERMFTILNTPIERALEAMDVIPITTTILECEEKMDYPHTEAVAKNTHATAEDVEIILNNIFTPVNEPYNTTIDAKLNIISDLKDGAPIKFSSKLETCVNNYISIRGKKIGNRFYNKTYHPKDSLTAIRGMIKRYAENKIKLNNSFIDRLIAGYKSNVDEKRLKEVVNRGFNVEDMWYYTTEYLRKLQTKFPELDHELYNILDADDMAILTDTMYNDGKVICGNTAKEMLTKHNIDERRIKEFIDRLWTMFTNPEEFMKYREVEEEWFSSIHQPVNFHMKKQPKEVRTPGYDGIFKAGQGVSAWSKMYNIMVSGMIRYFDEIFNIVNQPDVQISYGKSDKDLSKEYAKMAGHTIKDRLYKKIINDFSEFDSCQEEISILAFAAWLRIFGFSTKCILFYINQRSSWVMFLRGKNLGHETVTILRGVFKKHSGEPATLCGNTWFNMAVIGMCVKFKNSAYRGYKGDDFLGIAKEIEIVKTGETYLWKSLGYKFKVQFVNYPEYIANICTPTGFYPDVIRRASRVISKIYNDKADWDEVKTSTADSLAVIDNLNDECAQQFLLEHYKEVGIKITKNEVDVLTNFLINVIKDPTLEPTNVSEYYQHTYSV